MSDSPPVPPRRIAPQLGPHVWQGGDLSPSDWMLATGAEDAAELQAALAGAGTPSLPRLAPVLREIAERCDHGRGFAVLRGLPAPGPDQAERLLGLLAGALGRVLPPPGPAPELPPPCDILVLLATGTAELTLLSAGTAHNALLQQDRAALETLYRPPEGEMPVFTIAGGIFAGRAAGPIPALAAIRDDAALPLCLALHSGELLFLNPFLAWPRGLGGPLLAAGVITAASRAIGPFAPPLEPPAEVGG
jgi:hypothetical protein